MISLIQNTYKDIEYLNNGNQAKIFLAKHKQLKKKFVIKIFEIDRQEKNTLFETESEVLGSIDSNYVVKIYDSDIIYFANKKFAILVLEYLSGQTISSLDRKTICYNFKINLCLEILKAINDIHQRGIIHNDLSPKNIIADIHSQRPIKIIDFAHAVDTKKNKDRFLYKNIAGNIDWVCPSYMSNKNIVSFNTDIYAAATIIYYILSENLMYKISNIKNKITTKKNYYLTELDKDTTIDVNIKIFLKEMIRHPKYRIYNLHNFISYLLSNQLTNQFLSNIRNI